MHVGCELWRCQFICAFSRRSIALNLQAVINTELQRGLLRDESPANVSLVGSIQYALLLATGKSRTRIEFPLRLTGLLVGRAFDRGWLLYLNCASLMAAPFGIMVRRALVLLR